jgi:hydrogenase-1 operon protein HyaE
MNIDLPTATAAAEFASSVAPPKALATPALVAQLVERHGARWVDEQNVDAWKAGAGDRVLFFAGDPVRFPEGLDVAVVLPELQRSFPGRFIVAVAQRENEDAVARRFSSQRWPSLMFWRDGQYVTVVAGMHDWDVYVRLIGEALAMPTSRLPGIGIPVVAAGGGDGASSCH